MKFLNHKLTRKSILAILQDVEYEFLGKTYPIKEQMEYLTFHADRYLFTLKLIEPFLKPGVRILDLGAFPFHLGILLSYLANVEITLSGLPVEYRDYDKQKSHYIIGKIKDHEFKLKYFNFNLEKETYPFEKEQFDLILCLEVIEHLIENPVFMLNEIHRIMTTNGRLILTTDNASRYSQLFKIMFNQNIWFKYYPGNKYFRHNREYILKELKELLCENGFDPDKIKAININLGNIGWKRFLNNLFYLSTIIPIPFLSNKRRHLMAICRKGKDQTKYPSSIYIKEPD